MQDDFRLAIIVNPDMPIGFVANTVGCIAVGLGAKLPHLGGPPLIDCNGLAIDPSSNQALPVLQANVEKIAEIMRRALPIPEGCAVVPFPAYGRSLHDFREYQANFASRDLGEGTIDGLGVAGPTKWVRSLTGSLKLLR